MRRQVFVNADDFGWTDGHNQAVILAHQAGVLQRASLLCNGDAFEEAIKLSADSPDLQVGIHLTLNEGQPIAPVDRIPHLTRQDGWFYNGLYSLIMVWLSGRLRKEEVGLEWRSQIERALQAGLLPSHLDSHKHVHVIPPLLKIAIDLATEFGIGYLRLPLDHRSMRRGPAGFFLWGLCLRARAYMMEARLHWADHFIGVGSSGHMRRDELVQAIRAQTEGLTEIMVHPAVVTPAVQSLQQRYKWAARYEFENELRALLSLRELTGLSK